MAIRDVLVRILGQETVSGASKKAEGAIDAVGATAARVGKALAALGVGAVLGSFFKSAIEEAAAAEESLGALEQAVLNSGTSFRKFAPDVDAVVAQMVRLTKFTDDDLYRALTRMVGISGDAQGSLKNLGLVADLAAFKHISLEEAATIVGKAMNGSVTAFNKLGVAGSDASTVIELARQSFGGFANKEGATFGGTLARLSNNWGEFKEAVGTAIISNESVREGAGRLVLALADLAQWVARNEGAISKWAGVAVDVASQLAGTLGSLWEALGPTIKLIGTGLPYGLQVMSLAFREAAAVVQGFVGDVAYFLGGLVLTGSNLLKVFGINVGQELGASLAQWGGKMAVGARRNIEIARETFWIGIGKLEADQAKADQRQQESIGKHSGIVGDLLRKGKEQELEDLQKANAKKAAAEEQWNKASLKRLEDLGKALAKERDRQGQEAADAAALLGQQLNVNLGEVSARALQMTTEAMQRLLDTLRGKIPIEQWQALNDRLQEHRTRLTDLLPPVDKLRAAYEEAADANKRIAEKSDGAQRSAGKLARDSAGLARAFVDAASSAGVIDSKMASVLNSAISLAASLPKAFSGDPQAIASAIASLANIIVGIGSSEVEKKRAANLAANSTALERLTREVGNLNLRESGKTFAGVQTAVDASIQARADARAAGKGPGAADEAAKAAFLKSLRSQGIGLEEARGLFKELFGRDLSMANAGLFFQDIQAFSEGLQQTEFGQFGKDFGSQLDAITKGFDIFGTTDADNKLAEFRDLVGRFSPALAQALAGDLSTPEGRAQAVANLQALFQKLKTGGLSPEEIGVSGNEFLSLISTILPLLADANGVLQSGAAVPGVAPTLGDTRGGAFGAPGLPPTTVGVEVPQIRGTLVPAPTTVTTTISGPITIVNQFPNVSESQEVLEKIVNSVDEALVRRYDALRAAQGRLAPVA